MPATTSPAVKLNGPQIGELVSILVAAFNYDELQEAVRVGLNLELSVEFAPRDKPLKVVADALVSGLNRRDRVGDLLGVVARARPRNEALPQFVNRVRSGAVTAEQQAGVVRDAIGAAARLARADGSVQGRLGPFKPILEVTREELDRLARYKSLHDCLHTLQLQLAALVRASRAFPADAGAGLELRSYVEQLRRLARSASQQITGLPTQEDESAWVADFEAAVAAAQAAIRAGQAAPLADAVRALGRLLPEAVRINLALTMAAKNLRLESLGEALAGLLDHPDQTISRQLRPGQVALLGLTPQLDGLVDTHDGWQRVDKALMAAEALPPSPPAVRVPRWGQVKPLLARLCPQGTEPDPLADPAALADRWEAEADQKAAENLFLSLRAASLHKFYDVDVQLRDLTERLADIVGPLNALLEVI